MQVGVHAKVLEAVPYLERLAKRVKLARLCPDQDAEDLVQEAVLKLLVATPRRFKEGGAAKYTTWAWKVARERMVDLGWKGQWCWAGSLEVEPLARPGEGPTDRLDREDEVAEASERVAQVMEWLAEDYTMGAALLALAQEEDGDVEMAGNILGLSGQERSRVVFGIRAVVHNRERAVA